jgi:hypothetical protein
MEEKPQAESNPKTILLAFRKCNAAVLVDYCALQTLKMVPAGGIEPTA